MKKKVAFYTLGCKVNQYETNAMTQKFIENNYEIVDFSKKADIYIINTCTVTNISDKKSRQMLRRAKQENQDAIVIAVGCYAQVAKDELEKIEEIDLVLGTNEKNNIVKFIEELDEAKEKSTISDVMKLKEFSDFGNIKYTEKTRAVIKIQDGCDRFCSYCIIPYARGRVRSRKIQSVVSEIKTIAAKGIKEVVITGIHIASYGKDFKEKIELIDLLEEINKLEGIERIRLGSIEPKIITKDFVQRLAKLDKICDHFHLSLQSGCDNTLQRMNRRYTIEEFENGVKLLREAYKNVALTTDIIVGFPGETEEEFKITYNTLNKIKFYQLHVFKYSPRKGTKAAVMDNQISPLVKEERSKKLIELSNKYKEIFDKDYIGKIVNVLWEQKENGHIKGHTSNYMMVYAKDSNIKENTISEVEIEDLYKDGLLGKTVT